MLAHVHSGIVTASLNDTTQGEKECIHVIYIVQVHKVISPAMQYSIITQSDDNQSLPVTS